MDLLVLVEQNVWDDFRPAVSKLGEQWNAPSGRKYRLVLNDKRLEVYLEHPALDVPPPENLIDSDLLALASQVYDAVGGEWSSTALKQTASAWGWPV
jgi:hypothetical protein